MDKKLLNIICCPISGSSLTFITSKVLSDINKKIVEGGITNKDGKVIKHELKNALVTEDGKLLYPINEGIPVLLEGESIVLNQL